MKLPVGMHDINKYIKIRKELIKTTGIFDAEISWSERGAHPIDNKLVEKGTPSIPTDDRPPGNASRGL
jgi:hypothetical protein